MHLYIFTKAEVDRARSTYGPLTCGAGHFVHPGLFKWEVLSVVAGELLDTKIQLLKSVNILICFKLLNVILTGSCIAIYC